MKNKNKIKKICDNFKEKNQLDGFSSDTPWFEYAAKIDQFATALVKSLEIKGICVIAIGGYGRSEVFPHSDIDVAVIYDSKNKTSDEFLRILADSFWSINTAPSIFAGTTTELINAIKSEPERLTSSLDHRFICGAKAPYSAFLKQFDILLESRSPVPFIKSKMDERDQNHKKFGNSRYCVEPNIKFGKGGLRDIHALYWITKRINQVNSINDLFTLKLLTANERKALKSAYEFLLMTRWHLHKNSKRPTDTLSLELQIILAEALDMTGKTPQMAAEKMMHQYFLHAKNIGQITRQLCAYIEGEYVENKITQAQKTFNKDSLPTPLTIKGRRISLSSKSAIEKTPSSVLDIFLLSQDKGLSVHPEVFRWIRAKKTFLKSALADQSPFIIKVLTRAKPEKTLRKIHEAGLLDILLPEFSHLNGLMQFDGYHAYTADEHIFTAVGILSGTINANEYEFLDLKQSPALMTAMLFHDIGKGRGGDHEKKGAEILQACAKRLDLNPQETELACFLVEHSGYMSDITFKRDLEDPKTLSDFCDTVESIARLRMLYALTLADSIAVGETFFTNWKDKSLRRTYKAAYDRLSGGNILEQPRDTLPPQEAVSIENDTARGATKVRIYTEDRLGLFRDLCGAFALADTRIIQAKIKTLDTRMALDEFYVQTPNQQPLLHTVFLEKHLSKAINKSLNSDEIKSALKIESTAPPSIIFDNVSSNTATLMEVYVPDAKGLLYSVASCLNDLNIQVISAQINTFKSRAIDVFYIRDRYGMKIADKRYQDKISKKITKALS